MKVQFTLFCTTGKYKPIATVVDVPNVEDLKDAKKFLYWKKRALSRIVAQRYESGNDLFKNGYTQMKWRIYDKEERKAYEKQQFIKSILERKNKN